MVNYDGKDEDKEEEQEEATWTTATLMIEVVSGPHEGISKEVVAKNVSHIYLFFLYDVNEDIIPLFLVFESFPFSPLFFPHTHRKAEREVSRLADRTQLPSERITSVCLMMKRSPLHTFALTFSRVLCL